MLGPLVKRGAGMTILFRLDNPNQFTVLVDGRERAKIRRAAENWNLYCVENARFVSVDVTGAITDHAALCAEVRKIIDRPT
jgi:hypothetical protein